MTALEPAPALSLDLRSAPLRADQNPARAYIASLRAQSSKRVQRHALQVLTDLATGWTPQDDPERRVLYDTYPWWTLRAQHTNALQALLYERYDKQATVNRHLAALRKVLEFCWVITLDDGTPLLSAEDHKRAVHHLKLETPHRIPPGREITMRELSALVEAAGDQNPVIAARDTAMLAIAFTTGARISEIVAMNVGDYYPETMQLRILKAKRHKQRIVWLEDDSRVAVADWLTVRGDWDGPLLCAVGKDGKLARRGISERAAFDRFHKLALKAGVPHLGTHDARRTVASRLLREGVDLVQVQKLLGHESASTTASYDRRGDEEIKRAVSRLRFPYRRAA